MGNELPREVLDGLRMARQGTGRTGRRHRVRVGNKSFTILRFWDGGFALSHDDAPHLRGLVDLFDGARHVAQCLVVAVSDDGRERTYEIKRSTPAGDGPAVDYARDTPAVAGLIER